MIFLISYDRRRQALTTPVETFPGDQIDRARQRRLAVQLALSPEEGRYEVVLLEADDMEAVKETHSRYFASSESDLIDQARDELRRAEEGLEADRKERRAGQTSG